MQIEYKNVGGVLLPCAAEDAAENEIDEEMALPEPTDLDRIEAQVLYTALMTGTLLEGNENV